MESKYLFIGFAVLILVSIIFSIIFIPRIAKQNIHVKLSQGKLKNTDAALKEVIPFLKITNIWEEQTSNQIDE